jgi:hypothetical protein
MSYSFKLFQCVHLLDEQREACAHKTVNSVELILCDKSTDLFT